MQFGRRARAVATVAGVTVAGVALSAGGAVAGSLITSQEIKNQTIKSWDVDQGAVGGSELRAGSVRQYHLREDSVGWHDELNDYTRNKIKSLAGKDGAPGDPGAPGRDGVSGYTAGGEEKVLEAGASLERTQECPEGKVALGGGYKIDDESNVTTGSDMPDGWTEDEKTGVWYPHSWTVEFHNTGDKKTNVTTYVVCASVK